ncbi:MAG: nucleotidyltransferase [Gemmatimonadaceae bacterium]|nr:nucleotidyltransferase [Gemmatimonadaceae bacterium]
MIQLIQQAADLQHFIRVRQWRSCLIGGIAVIRWGEPRLTRDVDLTLFVGFGAEESYVQILLAEFEARINDARSFALENRVLLLRGPTGIPIDVALAGFPFEDEMIGRATDFEYAPGIALHTVSAEDLIVLKAFANRLHDWTDIRGVAARQRKQLDWAAIRSRLEPLAELKGEPEILERLETVRASAAR